MFGDDYSMMTFFPLPVVGAVLQFPRRRIVRAGIDLGEHFPAHVSRVHAEEEEEIIEHDGLDLFVRLELCWTMWS